MAATRTRPAGLPPSIRRAGDEARRSGQASPAALAAALGVAILYAAFANGAIAVPDTSRLQVGVAVVAAVSVAGLLFGRGLVAAPRRPAAAGLALLGAFALWSALSTAWSIAPDLSWTEANQAIAYALVAGLALLVGGSLRRAAERVAIGYLAIATVVALYAVGGKAIPWLHIGSLIDLNHTARIARLREPIGYWNALSLFCVMAVPIAVRTAADGVRSLEARAGALIALLPLLCTIVLTYSRGGLLVLGAAFAVQFALSADRMRVLAVAGVGVVCALPATVLGLSLPDLTTDGVARTDRIDDGFLFSAALLAGALAAVALGRLVFNADERLSVAGPRMRLAAPAAGAACVVALAILIGAAASEGGLAGSLKNQARDVTAQRFDPQRPGRLLSANLGNRWDWWKEAVGATWDSPLVGHGAGSFPLLHRRYRSSALEVRQPHSVPMQFLAETGIVGAALGLGGLALLAAAAVSGALGRLEGRDRGYAIALLAGAAAWGLHLFVDWDWDIPAVTLPALAFLGVLAARPREAPGAPSRWRARPSMAAGPVAHALALAGACALLCAVIASAVLPSLAHDKVDDAFLASGTTDDAKLRDASKDAAEARRLTPLAVDPLLIGAAVAEQRGQYRREGTLLARAAKRQPDNAEVWLYIGRFGVLLDDAALTYRAWRNEAVLDPYNPLATYLYLVSLPDVRLSATATGTPLPEKIPGAAPAPAAPAPSAPAGPSPAPSTPAPATPSPPAAPAPTPAPAPSPAPAPKPAPKKKPFRLEG